MVNARHVSHGTFERRLDRNRLDWLQFRHASTRIYVQTIFWYCHGVRCRPRLLPGGWPTFILKLPSVCDPFCCLVWRHFLLQFFVNGIRVDTDVLSGAWTTWNARVLYYTYDITSYLTEGSNVIGVMLGHGWRDTSAFPPLWMSGPCDKNEMILRLAVVDSSSGSLIVGSDPLWNGGPACRTLLVLYPIVLWTCF